MNSIITTADEARKLKDGSKTVIVLPVKPQPEMIVMSKDAHVAFEIFNGPNSNANWAYKGCVYTPWPSCFIKLCASLQVGQRIYVREPYWSGYELDENDCIDDTKPLTIYLADLRTPRPFDVSDSYCMHMYGHDKRDWPSWKSAATMPKSAARMVIIPTDVQVKRVQEMTEKECENAGAVKMHLDDLGQTWKTFNRGFESDFATKYGQAAWDNNIWVYVGIVKTEMI